MQQPEPEPGKINLPFAKFAKYLAIGLEIPSTIIGPLILGYLIDRQFGTSPWVTVVAAFLGFIGAVFRLLKYLKYFAQDKTEKT
ncbi:MAG TPA: AtpZ/AtpI family protein [Candidatus Binatia bacterium]